MSSVVASITSSAASATSSAAAATSSAATKTLSAGKNLKIVGVILAIVSGLLIGSSFVFKKKGLLRSQAGHAGEGVGYLKSPLWWLGMSMMILGEICNFAAYAFVEAIVVTPLGALSVVVCAILSRFFLNEQLTFFGWLGCGLCILGSVIIALNGPKEESVGQIREFQKLFLAPGFIVYGSVLFVASGIIVFYFAPRYGKKSMLWYISVCSMIGGISVSVTTGLGAAIVQTALGDNQFKYWFMYFLMVFVIATLITEVYYLNVALALFNTAMVTPTYYVIFTFFSMVTTVVLFQGLHASVEQIITIVMAFLVICVGITILQMSKVDPVTLSKLDRRSTILLQAARSQTETVEEKGAMGIEDPGMDALRGSFGTVGSIIRARSARRMSQNSHASYRGRPAGTAAPYDPSPLHPYSGHIVSSPIQTSSPLGDHLSGMKRHQLYDAPVPHEDAVSVNSQMVNKRPTIKFDSQDMVHQYDRPGTGENRTTHEHRQAVGSPAPLPAPALEGYPPGDHGSMVATASDTPMNFMDLGSPMSGMTSSDGGIVRQTLTVSPTFDSDLAVRSAPPMVFPRRADSRGMFDNSPSTGTLLSFPSVTDSARSGSWDEVPNSPEMERGHRGRGAKRYPKGAGDDDREESVGLWRGSEDGDEVSPQAGPNGGIRLVPSSRNRF